MHLQKYLIKLKDVNSLVYQMESLGSKTANCITPEEQSPLHRNASLFISYIYHQWFWSLLYKKKNIKKSHIYTHKSASGRPLLLIILVFDSREFTSNLSCKYFDTMIEPPYFIKPSIYTVRMYILLIACLTCN